MATRTTSKTKPAEKPPVEVKEPAMMSKLPDILDAVVEKTGQKRAAVRPVVDALLSAMSEKLHAGEDLMLPPLGKIKVVKRKEETGIITLKLRPQNSDAKTAKKALADDED